MMTPIATLHSNVLPYAGVLVGIGIALVAVFFMLSRFLENRRLEAWSKAEAAQMIVPFLLLIALFIMEPIIAPLVQDIDPIRYNSLCDGKVVPDNMCHVVVGEAYLRSITEETMDIQQNLLRLSFYLSLFKSMFASTGQGIFSAVGVKITNSLVYAFTVPSLGLLNFLSRLIATTMMVSGGFLVLYRFLIFGFLPLVTLGFLLRILPATRLLGGLLIAIALASYYFLPLMLSVADSIYLSIPPAENNPPPGTSSDGMQFRISRFVPTGFDVYDFNGDTSDISSIFRNPAQGNPFETALEDTNAARDIATSAINSRLSSSTNGQITDISSPNALSDANSNSIVQETITSMLGDVNTLFSGKSLVMALDVLNGAYSSLVLATGFIFPNTAQGALSFDIGFADSSQISRTYTSPLVFILVDEITNVWVFIGLMLYMVAITLLGVIKTLSPLLGGDVEIAGLSRLI
jgi:hypothetical protein